MSPRLSPWGVNIAACLLLSGVTARSAAQAPAPPADQPPVEAPAQAPEAPPAAAPDAPPSDAAPPADPAPTPGAEPDSPPSGEQPPATDAAPAPPADAAEAAPPADPAPTPEAAPAEEAPAQDAPADDSGFEEAEFEESEFDDADFEEAAPAEDEDEEEIVVTGSRIKRSIFSSSAPVQIVSRKDLEYSGANNMGDVVKYLSVSSGAAFSGRGQFNGGGTSQVNLRGLGPGATLVLLNGRRVVTTGAGVGTSYVDLNTIPVSAIERVEVMKGGASAIYGADAVAGVVNIITRKKYNGARGHINGMATMPNSSSGGELFDQTEADASLAFGAANDKSRVTVAFSALRRNPLPASSRDFTDGTFRSTLGWPGVYLPYSERNGAGPLGISRDPGCEDPDRPYSEFSSVDDGGFCAFNYGKDYELVPKGEGQNIYAHGEHDVSDYTTIWSEFGYARSRGVGKGSPSSPVLAQNVWVSDDHVDNPFDGEQRYVGRALGHRFGPSIGAASSDTVRTAFGVRGELEDAAANTIAESWSWELYGSWGVSRYRSEGNDTLLNPFQTALDSCDDPTDLSGCFNPFASAYPNGPGTQSDGTPNSTRVINGFTNHWYSLTDQSLVTADASVSGHLFELPGGDFGFAVGSQYRHEARSIMLNSEMNNFAYGFVYGNTNAHNDRDVIAGFAEVSAPLLDGLELSVAGRHENYTDAGSAFSPQAGIVVVPASLVGRDQVADELHTLRFRGNIARAFRAPNLFQQFAGSTTIPTSITDVGATTPAFVPINTAGDPDLEPEDALAMNAGFEWLPIDELGLEFDYWRYDFDNIIVFPDAQGLVDGGGNSSSRNNVVRDDSGMLLQVNRQMRNAANMTKHGVDFGTVVRLLDEELTVAVSGTYVISTKIPLDEVPDNVVTGEAPEGCDGDECEISGQLNARNFGFPEPKLKLNLPVLYRIGDHIMGLTGHYIHSYMDDDNVKDSGDYTKIDAMVTLDAQYTYEWAMSEDAMMKLSAGVLNVFDTQPPAVGGDQIYGYDPLTHDPRGRLAFVRIEQELE